MQKQSGQKAGNPRLLPIAPQAQHMSTQKVIWMKKEMMVFAMAAIMLAGLLQATGVPVITSLTGPSSIQAEEYGVWTGAAYDPGGQQVGFTVNWGDGSQNPASGSYMSHEYTVPGTYTITAIATSPSGNSNSAYAQVQVTPIPAPTCPGYKALRTGESISTGTYSLYFDSVEPQSNIAHYTLYNGINKLTEFTVFSGGTGHYNVPNGDELEIDACSNAVSPSMRSRVKFSIVSGPSLRLASGSNIIPDDCAANPSFKLIHVGEKVSTPSAEIRLSDISVATGASNIHPAILDITDKISSQTNQIIAVPHLVYSYTLPSGKEIIIGICQANPGFALNSKWVILRVTEDGSPNQPPVITGVSGPTVLNVHQPGEWSVSAYDPDGDAITYRVNVSDGENVQTLVAPSNIAGNTAFFEWGYRAPGSYTITFFVNDSHGSQAQANYNFNVIVPGTSPIHGDCTGDSGYEKMPPGMPINVSNAMLYLNGILPTAGETRLNADFGIVPTNGEQSQYAITPEGTYRSFNIGGAPPLTISVCSASLPETSIPYGEDWRLKTWALVKISDASRVYTNSSRAYCEFETGFTMLSGGGKLDTPVAEATFWDVSVYPVFDSSKLRSAIFHISPKRGEEFSNPGATDHDEVAVDDHSSHVYTFKGGDSVTISVCHIAPGFSGNAMWAEAKVTYNISPPSISGSPQSACNDTDGGKDFYKKGMVTQGKWEYLDICVTKNRLFENYCNGTTQAIEAHICEYGCFEGACNPQMAPAPDSPPAPPVTICGDGTKEGECSAVKPKMCVNGVLTGNAAQCGCPAGTSAVGTQCASSSVAAPQPSMLPVPAQPSKAMKPAVPLPEQPSLLERILSLLEEIKQILLQILKKI